MVVGEVMKLVLVETQVRDLSSRRDGAVHVPTCKGIWEAVVPGSTVLDRRVGPGAN